MKLINTEGKITIIPLQGIIITDKTPVEISDSVAKAILEQEPSVHKYEDKPAKKEGK